ncbi:hypothetical protein ACNJX9_17830 [Bradyrhizobium sp. DASA03076]|uniref:hypothetical protein n=1 Tax=Bradyrhizobium sp. BLXBL-03 TaxID=3395916 RepID=UPI003F722A0D
MTPLESFLTEMREQPCFGAELVDAIETVHRTMEVEARTNKNTREFLRGVEWIISRKDKSLVDRFDALLKMTSFETPVVAGMCVLTNWSN